MRKMILFLILGFLIAPKIVNATASGPVYVYYENDLLVNRKPTYTHTKTHMESIGYTVYERKNWDSSGLLYALQDAKIFVVHYHGLPGVQDTATISGNSYGIWASGVSSTYYKGVNSLNSGSTSQLKIAILYGCQTGKIPNAYGNLPQVIVNKGAQTALAWTVDTTPAYVNEWNRLFFEKAKTGTILASMQHADYWLREIWGNDAANQLGETHRNEAGNIYGYVY